MQSIFAFFQQPVKSSFIPPFMMHDMGFGLLGLVFFFFALKVLKSDFSISLSMLRQNM